MLRGSEAHECRLLLAGVLLAGLALLTTHLPAPFLRLAQRMQCEVGKKARTSLELELVCSSQKHGEKPSEGLSANMPGQHAASVCRSDSASSMREGPTIKLQPSLRLWEGATRSATLGLVGGTSISLVHSRDRGNGS